MRLPPRFARQGSKAETGTQVTSVMPIQTTNITDLPAIPAVYAMYGGQGRSQYVAYVGLGTKLRGRIEQHLVRRDSSVTTGVSAESRNPEFVTQVRWWQHPDFEKQDILEAAELVAFDVLEPSLRSRGGITDRAKQVYAEQQFQTRMRALFELDREYCGRTEPC